MDEFLQTHRTVLSGDARDALLDALKGEFMPALSGEARAKISAANKGRKVSAEARARMSIAQRGRTHGPLSAEHC